MASSHYIPDSSFHFPTASMQKTRSSVSEARAGAASGCTVVADRMSAAIIIPSVIG